MADSSGDEADEVEKADTTGAVVVIIVIIILAAVAGVMVFIFRAKLGLGDKCNCCMKDGQV